MKGRPIHELEQDYLNAVEQAGRLGLDTREVFDRLLGYQRFFARNAFRVGPYPQALRELALAEPTDSPVRQAVLAELESGTWRPDRPWLRRLHVPATDPIAPLVRTIAPPEHVYAVGHSRRVADREGRVRLVVWAGGGDKTIRPYDLSTGERLTPELTGHTGAVLCLAAAETGRTLVSGGNDPGGNTLRVWNPASGRELFTLTDHPWVASVGMSGDGRVIASGGGDNLVRVWRVASESEASCVWMADAVPRSVGVSGDGDTVVFVTPGVGVRTFCVSTGRVRASRRVAAQVTLAAVSRDGRVVAVACSDGAVRLWEGHSLEPLHTLVDRPEMITSLCLSGDGGMVAAGFVNGTIRAWDTASGGLHLRLPGHVGMVSALQLDERGETLLSGGVDARVRTWRTTARSLADPSQLTGDAVTAVRVSDDARTAVSETMNGVVRVFDTATGEARPVLGADRADRLTADGMTNEPLPETGDELWATDRRGEVAVSGDHDGSVRIWSLTEGRLWHTLKGHDRIVRRVGLTPDGRIAVSVGAEPDLRWWDTSSGRLLREADLGWGHDRGISRDGRVAAGKGEGGKLLIVRDADEDLDPTEMQPVTDGVESVAVNADGRMLAAADKDGRVMVWHLADPPALYVLGERVVGVDALKFCHSGRTLILAAENTISLWEIGAAARSAVIPLEARIAAIDVGSWPGGAGDLLVVGLRDGNVHFFHLETPAPNLPRRR